MSAYDGRDRPEHGRDSRDQPEHGRRAGGDRPGHGRRDALNGDVVDSRTAEVLRRALRKDAAAVVSSGDGLQRIRARTAQSARRPAWLMPIAVAAASTAVIGGVGWAAVTGLDGAPVASSAPAAPPATVASTAARSPSSPAEPPATPEGTRVALPVYYVGLQPGAGGREPEYRLFREYHPTTVEAAPGLPARVELAVSEMLAGTADDPDYRADGWPAAASIRSASVDPATGVVTVDLTGVDTGADPTAGAAAAVQQLVFTATGAAASEGFEPTGVEVLVDGEPADELLGTAVAGPLVRDAASFRAAVWVLSPAYNQPLTAPFTVSGEALSGQGSVRWELRSGADVVAAGEVELAPCCGWQPFTVTVDDESLAPGAYDLSVSVAGGSAVDDAPSDSKRVVIART